VPSKMNSKKTLSFLSDGEIFKYKKA
jgi:hypothetical protein